jgi:hypothetical protein
MDTDVDQPRVLALPWQILRSDRDEGFLLEK